jgi:hypothetical protein
MDPDVAAYLAELQAIEDQLGSWEAMVQSFVDPSTADAGLLSTEAAQDMIAAGKDASPSGLEWVEGAGVTMTQQMADDWTGSQPSKIAVGERGGQYRRKVEEEEEVVIVPPAVVGPFDPAGPDSGGPSGPFDPGGWFDDDEELDPISEGGLPKFSKEELVYARNLLEAELRMAGFDNSAIGRMMESWIIPRLTGTYVEETTGVTMLPPDTAEDLLPELFEQQEFKNRFPGYHKRLDAGYNAIDVQDYLSYETRFNELMVSYGLDSMITESGTTAKEYVGDLIGGNVSVAQVDKRITQGVAAVLDAPEEVLKQYEEWYGSEGENALLAQFLDPNADLIDLANKAGAASAGGYAQRILGSGIDQEMATDIADLDYTNQQLYQAYTALAQQTALFAEKAGEQDFSITEEGVEYALNLDSETIQDMEVRRRSRSADFQGGGGAMVSGTTTGFGSANA